MLTEQIEKKLIEYYSKHAHEPKAVEKTAKKFSVCKKTVYNILHKYEKKTPTELKKEHNNENDEPKKSGYEVKPIYIEESGVGGIIKKEIEDYIKNITEQIEIDALKITAESLKKVAESLKKPEETNIKKESPNKKSY